MDTLKPQRNGPLKAIRWPLIGGVHFLDRISRLRSLRNAAARKRGGIMGKL